MDNKIEVALQYYNLKQKEILNQVNSKSNLTTEQIIDYGQEMAILEYKITALEVAKEN
ncbi:hypothetical protein [Olleya aquimaris]|uniref:Uncharacterized protein n=1 Tax=Olleya aquimaris TaxID=639310 RepID=A0A327RM48_9FLAO|nr:hypothetical protein [Olleya aquimaris]RAJ17989.1 hypothetical protein LY08_00259 [Olleya aquimaris]